MLFSNATVTVATTVRLSFILYLPTLHVFPYGHYHNPSFFYFLFAYSFVVCFLGWKKEKGMCFSDHFDPSY